MENKLIVMFLACVLSLGIVACGESTDENGTSTVEQTDQKSEEAEDTTEGKKGLFDASYTVDTSVAYSAGDDGSWAYGNQRKEFPNDKSCYVRIGSTVKTDKKSGVDGEITVTYKFTGTDGCNVKLTDGIADEVSDSNPNTQEFSRTLYAKKGNKATEDVIIFQYQPQDNAEEISLEVIYDDTIEERYDIRNSIYFTSVNQNDASEDASNNDDYSDEKKENGIN